MNSIIKHIVKLYEEELFSNVVNLAELALSICDQKQDYTPYIKFQLLIFHADSLFHLQNYVQAELSYQQALQIRKYVAKLRNTAKLTDNLAQTELLSDIEIKYKIFLCCMRLKLTQKAIDTLQSITAKYRTPKINMALANVYRDAGYERSAITSYREVLRECPLAIEAAENLLKLGVSGTEVNSLMIDATSDMNWMSLWLRGQAQMQAREFTNAVQTFRSLESTLCDNARVSVIMAQCFVYLCEERKALAALQTALHLEPTLIKGRDLLANLLATSGDKEHLRELERLVNPDLDMSLWSSEHWVVMGWYMYALKKYERAAYFGAQACVLNRRNVEGLLLKAHALMQICNYHDAMLHFREVIQYTPCRFDAHKGIVEANFSLHRLRESLTLASNACKQLNHSPQALTLYASALMKDPVTTCKARTYLDRALSADPTYAPAVCLLAEYLDQEQRHEEACALLQRHVDKHPTTRLHQLLADCLARMQKDDEAFSHYSAALRLDPHNQRAIEGLNALGRSPTKLDSSFYMSVAGGGGTVSTTGGATTTENSSSYESQVPTGPSDDLDDGSDSDVWPTNPDFMAYE